MNGVVNLRYEDRMIKQIESCIRNHVKKHKCNYVIYPYGKRGVLGKQILNDCGVVEKYIVDDKKCLDDSEIKSVAELREDYLKDKSFVILLLADYANENNLELYQQISDFAEVDRIIDVCSPSMFYNPEIFLEKIYLKQVHRLAAIECIEREIYRNNIAGAVAEAGVYRGKTAMHINYLFPDRTLYLFDTFAGFSEEDQKEDDSHNRYNLKIDYSDTTEAIVLKSMRFPKNCIIKKGWFPESAKDVNETFAFVRLDMDLYEPILAGLRFFYPRMAKGGYIAIHDCRSKNFAGARDAVEDFCREQHINFMCMPDGLGTAVISIGY